MNIENNSIYNSSTSLFINNFRPDQPVSSNAIHVGSTNPNSPQQVNYYPYISQSITQSTRHLVGVTPLTQAPYNIESVKNNFKILMDDYSNKKIDQLKLVTELNYLYYYLKQLTSQSPQDQHVKNFTNLCSELVNFISIKFKTEAYSKQISEEELKPFDLIFNYPIRVYCTKSYNKNVNINIINKQNLLNDFFIYCWIDKNFEAIQILIDLLPQFFKQSADLNITFQSGKRSGQKNFQITTPFGALLAASGLYKTALRLIKHFHSSESQFLNDFEKKAHIFTSMNSYQLFDIAIKRQEVINLWHALQQDLDQSIFINQICLLINIPPFSISTTQLVFDDLYKLFSQDLKDSSLFVHFYPFYYKENLVRQGSPITRHFHYLLAISSNNNQIVSQTTLQTSIPNTSRTDAKSLEKILGNILDLDFSNFTLKKFKTELEKYRPLFLEQPNNLSEKLASEIYFDIEKLFYTNLKERTFSLDFFRLKDDIFNKLLLDKALSEKHSINDTFFIQINDLTWKKFIHALILIYLIEDKDEKLDFILSNIKTNKLPNFSFKINYRSNNNSLIINYQKLEYWLLLLSFEKNNLIKNQISSNHNNKTSEFIGFLFEEKQAEINNQMISQIDVLIQNKSIKACWHLLDNFLKKENYISLITNQLLFRSDSQNNQETSNRAWKDLFSLFGHDGLFTLAFFSGYEEVLNSFNQDPLEIKPFFENVIHQFSNRENLLAKKDEEFLKTLNNLYNKIILKDDQDQDRVSHVSFVVPISFVTSLNPINAPSSLSTMFQDSIIGAHQHSLSNYNPTSSERPVKQRKYEL